MITKENIASFINYLHLQRNGSEAPAQLISKWEALSNDEIRIQLNNLFDSWQIDATTRAAHISEFVGNTVSATKENIQEVQSTATVSKPKRNYSTIIFLLLFVPLMYVAYQYFLFKNLKPIYAITNNLSVRNKNNDIIGRMDLQAPEKTDVPSYSELFAASNDIVERAIDSTGKLKKHREVMLCSNNFLDFLMKKTDCIAYVNANYITSSKEEYNKYKTVFGNLSDADANDLELKYRKIIVGSLQFDKGELENKYLVSTAVSNRKDLRKKFSGFLKQEIIANNSYVVIAKMSDGYYYRFYGDLATNEYQKPKRIGYVEAPITDEESIVGDVLFKYNSKKKVFNLYDKDGADLHFYSIHDNNNKVTYFKFDETYNVQEEENILDQGADFIDELKGAIQDVGDKIKDATQ